MSSRFPRMGSRELMRLLHKHGFVEKRQTGSHRIYSHSEKLRVVTLPMGKKDLPLGTVRAILREAGISSVDV